MLFFSADEHQEAKSGKAEKAHKLTGRVLKGVTVIQKKP
jgi:hypothetical protein